VLHLEVGLQESDLTIGAHEDRPDEDATIRHYERVPVSPARIEKRCEEIVGVLNRANRDGRLAPEALRKLREVGQVFYDEFFPSNIKQTFHQTKAEYLKLYLDDQSVYIPWELLHDGERFLCSRFNVGRLVKTRQSLLANQRRRELSYPLKMLILADPQGDLRGAYEEGAKIRDYMELNRESVSVSLRSGNITPDFVKEKIRNFDLVHFAGHAEYSAETPEKSGWRLTGNVLSAREVCGMAGNAAMPALIFSNACQSARTKKWTLGEDFQEEVFGLANAFLLAGVKHYVGTFWEVLDEPSSAFSLAFYRHLLSGKTMGEAVRLARRNLIEGYGEDSIVWTSYLLYGDPTSCYLEQIGKDVAAEESEAVSASLQESQTRAREEIIDFSGREKKNKKAPWWLVAAGVLVLAAALFLSYRIIADRQVAGWQSDLLVHYHDGDLDAALHACDVLQAKRPDAPLPYLIRGHVFLRGGKLDEAHAAYGRALTIAEIPNQQRAEALSGLGRIASLRKDFEEALKYYGQATEADPGRKQGYLSQAFLLDHEGRHREALALFLEAERVAPGDRSLAALVAEVRKRMVGSASNERQDRVDRLIDELSTTPGVPKPLPADEWTSTPWTMWIPDFEVHGYSLHEGEDRLIVAGIVDWMLKAGRVQPVERGVLDKVLGEFKLGTSKLIDPGSTLSLGKMVAARLILLGRIVYSERQTQVSMRLIETETGRIMASINESVGSAVPVSVLGQKLATGLSERLRNLYPLRGRISAVQGEAVKLNIGKGVGVETGQKFKVLGDETVLKITSVEKRSSLAEKDDGGAALMEGMRVEALPSPEPG